MKVKSKVPGSKVGDAGGRIPGPPGYRPQSVGSYRAGILRWRVLRVMVSGTRGPGRRRLRFTLEGFAGIGRYGFCASEMKRN